LRNALRNPLFSTLPVWVSSFALPVVSSLFRDCFLGGAVGRVVLLLVLLVLLLLLLLLLLLILMLLLSLLLLLLLLLLMMLLLVVLVFADVADVDVVAGAAKVEELSGIRGRFWLAALLL